jgi:protein O-mannosyl-transferase
MNKKQKQNAAKKVQSTPKIEQLNQPNRFLLPGIVVIIIATFISMSPALKNEFVSWDDYHYIRDNQEIRSLSAENIAHLFHYKTFIMGNYHPFTMISYALEYKIFGLNPFWYHLNNILLHLINVLLAAYIMWLLTKKMWAVIIMALLFAIHPMRVESVVWAAERKDVLYTLFYFLALISYIKFTRKDKFDVSLYFISLLCFLFSLFSKGQAVVLPLTFILIDYWEKRKFNLKLIAEKVPFFALSLLFGILAILAQSSSLTDQRFGSYTLIERLVFAAYNLVAYLHKLIYPYNLACFYGYPSNEQMWMVYIGAIASIGLVVYGFIKWKNNPVIVFGSLFFLFTIFIVIQILPVGNAIIADRYTYIPYFGLFFIIAILVSNLIENNKYKNTIIALVIAQGITFAIASYAQSKTWKNNETLWLNVLKNNPNEPVAHNNLGIEYIDQKQYEKGIKHVLLSIEHKNRFSELFKSYNNLGKGYSETKQYDKAIEAFNNALKISPGFVDGLFNRGLTYTDMQQYRLAINDFNLLLKLNPTHPQAYYSRAMAYRYYGIADSAIFDYTKAIELKPDYSDAYTNRGNVYFLMGNFETAIENYNVALKLTPKDANTWLNRSKNYYMLKNYKQAYADMQQAFIKGAPYEPQYEAILKDPLGVK